MEEQAPARSLLQGWGETRETGMEDGKRVKIVYLSTSPV